MRRSPVEERRRLRALLWVVAVGVVVVLGCCAYVGLLDAQRLSWAR